MALCVTGGHWYLALCWKGKKTKHFITNNNWQLEEPAGERDTLTYFYRECTHGPDNFKHNSSKRIWYLKDIWKRIAQISLNIFHFLDMFIYIRPVYCPTFRWELVTQLNRDFWGVVDFSIGSVHSHSPNKNIVHQNVLVGPYWENLRRNSITVHCGWCTVQAINSCTSLPGACECLVL